jgi:hypothetical protein
LGPYNGIHLVLRSKSAHPAMAAIVTSRYADAVLEAEAERQHARFVVRPFADNAFLDTVGQSLCVSASPNSSAATLESAVSQDH